MLAYVIGFSYQKHYYGKKKHPLIFFLHSSSLIMSLYLKFFKRESHMVFAVESLEVESSG